MGGHGGGRGRPAPCGAGRGPGRPGTGPTRRPGTGRHSVDGSRPPGERVRRLDQLAAGELVEGPAGDRRDDPDPGALPDLGRRPGEGDVVGARPLDEGDLAGFPEEIVVRLALLLDGRGGAPSLLASRAAAGDEDVLAAGPAAEEDRDGEGRVDRDPVVGRRAVDDDRDDVVQGRLIEVGDAVDDDLGVAGGALGHVDGVRGVLGRLGQGG